MIDEGVRLIEYLQSSGDWTRNRLERRQPVGLSDDQMNFTFAVAEGAIRGKTKGQYPAPLVALKAIREGCNRTLEDGLKAELAGALELVGSPIASNLIGVFFMQNRLGRDSGVVGCLGQAQADQTRRRDRSGPDGRRDRHGARPVGHPDDRWSMSTNLDSRMG